MANPLKWLLAGCWVLSLVACAVRPPAESWPAALPPVGYFQQQWQLDAANRKLQSQADYLLWVERFYVGFNLAPGWLDMMQQVRGRVTEAEWRSIEPRLQELGRRIGSEWSKDNSLRRIDTRIGAVWRDALVEALSQRDLAGYLTRLEQDVGALLRGELAGDSIRFERYYVDEFDF